MYSGAIIQHCVDLSAPRTLVRIAGMSVGGGQKRWIYAVLALDVFLEAIEDA